MYRETLHNILREKKMHIKKTKFIRYFCPPPSSIACWYLLTVHILTAVLFFLFLSYSKLLFSAVPSEVSNGPNNPSTSSIDTLQHSAISRLYSWRRLP